MSSWESVSPLSRRNPLFYVTRDGECYVLGFRYHHGLLGLQVACLGLCGVAVGAWLAWDDRKDIRKWFRPERH